MADAPPAGWFPVLTLLIGFGAHALFDWLKDRRATERERESRAATRKYQNLERRIGFQRQTLLDLQEAVLQLGRATSRINHLDKMAYRENGKWAKTLLPDDLDESYRAAHARTFMLAARVLDNSVRELVTKFKDYSAQVGYAKTHDEAERGMRALDGLTDELNERIGERLRSLDNEERAQLG
jgi:uncharacterized coiled-coil protein SlyX